jgi:alpha-glucosidase
MARAHWKQEIKVQVNTDSLCVTVTDKSKEPDLTLTMACTSNLENDLKSLMLTPESFTHAYGLGEKFIKPGVANGDWIGQSRIPGVFGNVQEPFNKGSVGNDQFPILYLAGAGLDSYALFLDNPYKQIQLMVILESLHARQVDPFYILTGKDCGLRWDYMELVGSHPFHQPWFMVSGGFENC